MVKNKKIEELYTLIQEENKEFHWILRELYEARLILKFVSDAQEMVKKGEFDKARTEIKKLIGVVRKEGRIEFKLNRAYSRMVADVKQLESFLKVRYPKISDEIDKLVKQAEFYSSDLTVLYSSTGKINSLLQESEKDNSKLSRVLKEIKDSFASFTGFEIVISDLIEKYKVVVTHYEHIQNRLEKKDFDFKRIIFEDVAKDLVVSVDNLDAIREWITKEIEAFSEMHSAYSNGFILKEKFVNVLEFIAMKAKKRVNYSLLNNMVEVKENYEGEETVGQLRFMNRPSITYKCLSDGYAFRAEVNRIGLKFAIRDFLLS